MPKITRHGGPTNAAVDVPQTGGPELLVGDGTGERLPELLDRAYPPDAEPLQIEGGEDLSAGNSSSVSGERPPPSGETNAAGHQQPAPTTVSRSSKGRKGSSTAPSTDGSTPATT